MAKPFLQTFTKRLFIICNVFIAICFVSGSFVKFFNPRSWWFIGLFTLSLPYILVVLIIFFIGWLLAKKIFMLISLLAIAFCWKAVQNIFPFHFPTSFKTEKQTGDIRVMSWNVEHFDILEYKTHPEIKQKMVQLIKQYQPDVACFQEMVAGDDDRAINYLGDFKRNLQFSDYYYSYENRLNFDQAHHFGVIIFSRFPIINKQTVGTIPYDYNSIFQYIDIVVNIDTIRIFNIHLQSLKFTQNNLQYLDHPGTNTDSALSESKSIVGKLKRGFLKRAAQSARVKAEIDKSPYPFIVCGDFNDVPNSYAYCKIGDGLQNAFVEKGSGIGRTFTGISPTLRIDNIFTDNNFIIQQFTQIPKRLSDHYPIITDVALRMSK